MDWRIELRKDIERTANIFIADSIQELKDQGYDASGRGIASFEYEIQQLGLIEFIVHIKGAQYLVFLDSGTRPHFPPVSAIFEWVKLKGLGNSDKERKSISWAIATNISKRGTPSPESFRFSRNGRRTKWIEFAQLAAQKRAAPIFQGSKWARFLFDEILLTPST